MRSDRRVTHQASDFSLSNTKSNGQAKSDLMQKSREKVEEEDNIVFVLCVWESVSSSSVASEINLSDAFVHHKRYPRHTWPWKRAKLCRNRRMIYRRVGLRINKHFLITSRGCDAIPRETFSIVLKRAVRCNRHHHRSRGHTERKTDYPRGKSCFTQSQELRNQFRRCDEKGFYFDVRNSFNVRNSIWYGGGLALIAECMWLSLLATRIAPSRADQILIE